MSHKYLSPLAGLLFAAAVPMILTAQEAEYASPELKAQIKSAMKAAPASISADATVLDARRYSSGVEYVVVGGVVCVDKAEYNGLLNGRLLLSTEER